MENLNPFDDPNGVCCVLSNDQQQFSLWPDTLLVPAGWHVVFGPSAREQCANWLEENWRDMRPQSLRLHDAASFEQE
ncbi:MbtH family protein [Hafnia psychrotolerans]|uniref:Protein mbtH n=1 Tax=Hafnia psychrotolerans TaxID=1477018 RepID=A0ABQ1FTE4_9GAMM|nr:MbtH family NRPS accessory protein [Hafnia psychrotolerans]GGA30168.1 protein mbtH [Hafnia psychrotolerans]